MHQIIVWVTVIIAIEAIVEILTESILFEGFRSRLHDLPWEKPRWYFSGLFSCGYCLSVWVSAAGAFVIQDSITNIFVVDIIIKIFVLHRLSNIWHEVMKRVLDRIPLVLAFKPESLESMESKVVEVLDDDNEG